MSKHSQAEDDRSRASANAVSQLVSRNFNASNAELRFGNEGAIGVRALAEEYGTPLFVYDSSVLASTWKSIRRAFPDKFEIYYSIKANPHQAMLQFFLRHGCGLEVASAGEIHQSLAAGCSPSSIIFAGPGKTDAELKLAVELGLGEIHLESLQEAKRLGGISKQAGKITRVALRVNATADAQGGAMRMGGKPSPFGIDEEELAALLPQFVNERGIEIIGVHLFTGTQILDHEVLLAQYRKAIDIGRMVAAQLSRPLQTIDFGGGLGIPYFPHEQPLDLRAFSCGLQGIVEAVATDPLLREARLIVEPGRFLVGEAGVYVSRVVETKSSRGQQFVIVDGGMHHHLAASGNLGQTIKRNFPVALLEKLDQDVGEPVNVVGPLCTPLDVLGRNVRLPNAEVGDLFGVFQSGAYARTASPLGFLSHPAPPEILVEHSQARLIRRRGEPDDLILDQVANADKSAFQES